MFKVGTKVKVIDDNQSGVVTKVVGSSVIVEMDSGFNEAFNASELLLAKSFLDSDAIIQTKDLTKPIARKVLVNDVLEVDLHFGKLVDFPNKFSPHEKLTTQIDKVNSTISFARKNKISKLIFIHGKGKGRLEEEVIKILQKEKKISFYDAEFRKYKGGAVQVEIRY